MDLEAPTTDLKVDENSFTIELTKTFVTSIVATAGMVTVALVVGVVKAKLVARKAKKAEAEKITEIITEDQ